MAMTEKTLACLGPHGFHELAYCQWAPAAPPAAWKPLAICAHGLTRNGRDFDALAAALSQDRVVLAPDFPGRGRSAWLPFKADYGYPLYLADAAALIARGSAELGGDAGIDWIGTSMGGIVGMMLASLPGNPIRRLVVNDVGPFIPSSALQRLATYVGVTDEFSSLAAFEAHIRRIHAPFGSLSDAQWHHLAVHSARPTADGGYTIGYDPAIGDALKGPLNDVDLWAFWDRISCPTLVIRGALSDLLSIETAQAMRARGPKAALVEIPDAGHAPALMAQEQIELVRKFLDG